MCGLVGVAGLIGKEEREIFRHLHIFDILRGDDSSGIFTVDTDGKVEGAKAVGWPDALREVRPSMFDWKGNVKTDNLCVIAGHNRAATTGKVVPSNAHPFDFEHVIGMHNGTLDKWSMFPFKGHAKFSVDSQILFCEINTDNDFRDIYKRVGGALALVWWDRRNSSLNIVRNKERSLYYTYINDRRTFVWASEAWMIHAAVGRVGSNQEIKVYGVPEHTWMKFFPTKREIGAPLSGVDDNFEKLEEFGDTPYDRFLPPYKPEQNPGNYGYGAGTYKGFKALKNSTTASSPSQLKKDAEGLYLFLNGLQLTRDEMEKKLERSCPCVWCDTRADIDEAKCLVWFTADSYLCEGCQINPEASSHIPYSMVG